MRGDAAAPPLDKENPAIGPAGDGVFRGSVGLRRRLMPQYVAKVVPAAMQFGPGLFSIHTWRYCTP